MGGMIPARSMLVCHPVADRIPPLPPPPWRARSFAPVVVSAGFDDARARALFLDALVAADSLPTLPETARALGVSTRTLMRARDWLRDFDPEGFAQLRERAATADATRAGELAAKRWGPKSR